jgi:ectoine hydroxylase-related dioxygenase (phytanoyl-CoA dioxygenase family)
MALFTRTSSALRGRFARGGEAATRRHPRRLGRQQAEDWAERGYVVLPRFFDAERVQQLRDEVDNLWQNRRDDDRDLVIDVFIDTPDEKRIRFRDAGDEARAKPYKLNDLYLVSDLVREMILDASLMEVVDGLLDGAPIVCNSLTFERGSQQRFHFDTFYMPPPVPNKMLATWIALEDADDRSGPLRYYPGSHMIPPYHFSDGRLNQITAELDDFDDYINKEIAERGLTSTTFPAKAGDVFIWHAQLYHGGSPIEDMSLTRKSLVTHYFRAQEMDPAAVEDIGGGRYYLRRQHQATE